MKVDLVNKPLDVETQRTIEDCVPDIHLIQDGTTLAVIELKFDAPLTPNQSSGRYSQVVGRGRVIFIVPEERKSEFDALVSVQGITLLSWRDVFARLEKYVIDATDRDSRLFLAALVHLKEFCK